MYKTSINEQESEDKLTFDELLNNPLDSAIVACSSDGDETFLVIPSMNDKYQNNIIYIYDEAFEAADYDSWGDDDLYSIKEVKDLHLILTV